jgi:hypothetical protein
MIKSIEIICKPCHRCKLLEERVRLIMDCIQFKYRFRVKYKYKFNKNVRDVEKYGYAIYQTPVLMVNGNVAFVGHVKGEHLIRMRLEAIMKEL